MKKLQVWLPLMFSIVLIIGMWIGSGLRKNIPFSQGLFETTRRSSLQEVMDLVKNKYVDKVSLDSLSDDAIQAMLAHLDPHSIFIPATRLTEVNEDLQGNFEGIGVEFFIISDTVNAVNVLAGGPSDKAGLQVGDKFLKVGDSVVTGKTINGDKIKKLLRGAGGSQVNVTVLRGNRTVQVNITRGLIPLNSLDAGYMINDSIGYIHLNKFASTTYKEFIETLEALQKKGMKRMVLDLRGNGGGILNEAADVIDEFLDDEKLIVYTQGNKQPKIEYRCKRPGLFEKGKLVLLVDEGSASASEIVAGALQDWDRATIVGRRTFGKGLVQEQFNLSNGAALRLTVARYYTPIGRNIQKPYDKGRDAYNDELVERFQNGEVVKGDSVVNHKGPVFKTKGGRTVYGGGGITPDVFVPLDTTTFSPAIYPLFDGQVFGKFIYSYYLQNLSYFKQFKDPADFNRSFTGSPADAAWIALVNFAAQNSVKLENISVRDKADIQQRIKTWMARQIWRMEGYYEVNNTYDPMFEKALEEIKK
ncbi:MAG: S41 family peptidase [Chitinophagaceae bacterium]